MTTDNSAPPPSTEPDALDSLTHADVLDSLTLEDVRPSPAPAAMPQGQGADAANRSSSILHGLHESLAVPGTSAIGSAMESAAIGAAKAVIETKDFLTGGEPDQGNKWSVRRWIEDRGQQLRKESTLNGIAQSVAQFGTGFIGLGKIKWVSQGLEAAAKAGKAARFGAETTRAAVAGAVAMDPHDERLSNLVEQYPSLRNPITSYLAARHDDSDAEGRLKNALEGIILDVGLAGALTAATKAYRFARAGDHEAANVAATEADDAFSRAIRGEQPTTPPDASLDPAITDAASKVREMNLQPSGPVMNAEHGPMESIPGLRGESGESRIVNGTDGVMNDAKPPQSIVDRSGNPSVLGGDVPHPDGSAGGQAAAGDGLRGGRIGETGSLDRDGLPRGDLPDASTLHAGPSAHAGPESTAIALGHVADDARALVQYGGRAEAIDAGYAFKSMAPPPSPGTTTSGVIPWQKFTSLDEAKDFTTALIRDQSAYINARRGGDAKGVLSDKAVDAMVADRVNTWNENPADLRGALRAAGDKAPELAADMEASFLVANKAYLDAYELAQRISVENYAGYASRDEALQALQYRMATATAMYAEGKAIVSNAARSMRRMRGTFKIDDDVLRNITTADPEQLLKIVRETNGNPTLLAKAGRITIVQRVTDALAGMQAANLLWSWKTQVVNFATSAAQLVWRPLEVNLGAAIAKRTAWRGDEQLLAQADSLRQQSVREVTYLGSVLSDGFEAARRSFIEGDSILVPHGQEHFRASGLQADNLKELSQRWRPQETMEDVVHNAMTAGLYLKAGLTGSLRMLGAADEFVKTMRYRAVVTAKASLEADQRGLVAGSKEYDDFMQSRVDGAFDSTGRGIDEDAVREAQSSTFQDAYVTGDDTWLGYGWANGYAGLTAQQSWMRLITPFIKTPTNLFRYGIKLTPGLNLTQKQYLRAFRGEVGAEEQARAIGQMALGTMIATTAITLWSKGTLTGSGPQDPQEMKQWRAAGHRPYSLTWTDEKGAKQYLDLDPFDPVAFPLVLVADWASLASSGALRPEEAHGAGMALMLAMMNRLKDKTYLKGIGDALNAMRDDRSLESWAKRTAPGFLPWSSLMSSLNLDPLMRETRGIMDNLIARVPGWSASLPPARDVFGDPIRVQHGLIASQQRNQRLDALLNDSFALNGHYLKPAAPKSQATGGVDLRDFTLKDGRNAYDRYQELAGHPKGGAAPLRDTLSDLIFSGGLNALPHGKPDEHGTKEWAIMDVVTRYRQAAFRTLLTESPELRDAVTQRKRETMKAIALGNQGKVVSPQVAADRQRVQGLLQAFGIKPPASLGGPTQ